MTLTKIDVGGAPIAVRHRAGGTPGFVWLGGLPVRHGRAPRRSNSTAGVANRAWPAPGSTIPGTVPRAAHSGMARSRAGSVRRRQLLTHTPKPPLVLVGLLDGRLDRVAHGAGDEQRVPTTDPIAGPSATGAGARLHRRTDGSPNSRALKGVALDEQGLFRGAHALWARSKPLSPRLCSMTGRDKPGHERPHRHVLPGPHHPGARPTRTCRGNMRSACSNSCRRTMPPSVTSRMATIACRGPQDIESHSCCRGPTDKEHPRPMMDYLRPSAFFCRAGCRLCRFWAARWALVLGAGRIGLAQQTLRPPVWVTAICIAVALTTIALSAGYRIADHRCMVDCRPRAGDRQQRLHDEPGRRRVPDRRPLDHRHRPVSTP